MNTNEKGAITEAKAVEYFTRKGYTVFLPFADTCSIDMLVVKDDKVLRIQCKTGALTDNGNNLAFSAKSVNKQIIKDYHGKIDFFFVYCQDLDRKFLYPIEDAGKSEVNIRLLPPLKKDSRINFAETYEIK